MRNLPKNFDALLEHQHRWPSKGDHLLRKSGDWESGASFANDAISRHVHIWDGYMSAGEALVEDCRQNPQARHFLIYPILFVYRHALELAMKWILTMYGGYAPKEILHHNLWGLWKLCREVLDAGGGDSTGAIDVVESIVKEMHDLDTSAFAFRYGFDKNGKPPRLPGGTYDLENIRDVMTGVGHFFDGSDGLLSELADAGP